MSAQNYPKPVPEPTLESQPFWDSLRAHQLKVQQCAACGKFRHYPRPVCDNCYSMDVKWMAVSGTGKVHSWTICHHAFHPGFKDEVPYIQVTVDLDEGVRMLGRLRGADASILKIGLPVRADFEDATDQLTLVCFHPA